MASINPITVDLRVGGQNVSRVGFGSPILVGFTGSRSILVSGSGQSGIVYKSVVRRATLSVQVTTAGAFSYALNAGVVEIEVPANTIVRDLIADFNANAPSPVTDVLSLEQVSQGLGDVVLIASAVELSPITYTNVLDLALLEYYYDTSDTEYQMLQDAFNSSPSPQNKYLLDVFGSADVAADVESRDDGSWYMLFSTSNTETENRPLAQYITGVKRMAIFCYVSLSDAQVVQDNRIAYLVHPFASEHPEFSWGAISLPNDPGSITWAYQGPLEGQQATTSTLPEILANRTARTNNYVLRDNLLYVDAGLTSDQDLLTNIDQQRSRDWVELNLESDLLSLLVNADGKIPYTNAGIQQVVESIADRLEQAGRNGIIRPIETLADSENAYGSNFFYQITAPTRSEIEQDNPSDLNNRVLNNVLFSYEEAGAIEAINVTGTVVIPT